MLSDRDYYLQRLAELADQVNMLSVFAKDKGLASDAELGEVAWCASKAVQGIDGMRQTVEATRKAR